MNDIEKKYAELDAAIDSIELPPAAQLVNDRRASEIASVAAHEIKDLLPAAKRVELDRRAAELERRMAARLNEKGVAPEAGTFGGANSGL